MLHDEIKTILPFYDDIEKQTRYRAHCTKVCEYKLAWPEYTLPPFQLRFEPYTVESVNAWYVRCAEDDSLAADLTPYISAIDSSSALAEAWYHYYDGIGLPYSIPCGDYYYELEIKGPLGSSPYLTYYSEIFQIVSGLNDIAFEQTDLPIFTLWRWYDDQLKTTANQSHCAAVCEYCLPCGVDALLPFMIRFTSQLSEASSSLTIISWELISTDETCFVNLSESMVLQESFGSTRYIYYDGAAFRSGDTPCGTYYSKLVVMEHVASVPIEYYTFYSEPVCIETEVNTPITNYILQENADRILLETGFGLLQE